MKLLIVESPNKIKKLKAILGADWDVAASVGHIRDLPSKELAIDKANGYKMKYEVNTDKKEVIENLKRKAHQAGPQNIYLASDPDREGEAISYHICEVLGLSYKTTKRVTFQELSDAAVRSAVASPRLIDLQLVAAQESRRAIDRLVGYEVSPVLWRKLESGLSAGRVQSVALRLCVERERTIQGFADKYNFQVTGLFQTEKGDLLKAKKKDTFMQAPDAQAYLQASIDKTFTVLDITTKPIEKAPQPPFSTSTLTQDGVKKLKMSVKRVMEVAQKLFEGGHITYMRTDSVNLSETAMAEAKNQILLQYGSLYHQERHFKSKAGSQEAHEAIRPTHWENATAGDTQEESKLYNLIYRRALASQMKAARYEETTITITSNVPQDLFATTARVLTFDGYLKAYQEENEEEEENGTIQPVTVGETLVMQKLEARQVYAKPPRRFDQATLVAELEKKGIGRPSTYASIINTILQRQYVETANASGRPVTVLVFTLEKGIITPSQKTETLGADKNKLIPTEKGMRLTQFLESCFSQIVDYEFTAKCEGLFDQVMEGKKSFAQLVPAFDKRLSEWIGQAESQFPDQLREGTVEIGTWQDHPITAGKGKYGTYVKCGDLYGSVKDKEPSQVTLAEAIACLEAKQQRVKEGDKTLVAQVGKQFQIRKGQYGLYLTDGKTNASLPKSVSTEEAQQWTIGQCRDHLKSHKEWKKARTQANK